MTLNKGEYGQLLYASMLEDLTGATDLEFVIEPRIGERIISKASIEIGTQDIVVGDERLRANEYLTYTVQKEDLEKAGIYRTQGAVTLNNKKIRSDFVRMTVLD